MAFRYFWMIGVFLAAPQPSNFISSGIQMLVIHEYFVQDSEDGKEEIERKYTPTSSDDDLGPHS